MIFGIDLGTTMSAIGRGSYTSRLISSNVDLMTMQPVAKDYAGTGLLSGYKIDQAAGIAGEKPRKAAAIILKELVRIAEEDTGEKVTGVIICVPANFSVMQRESTVQAARSVGIEVKEIINEPTAAAYLIGVAQYALIWDLGGGTFDVTLAVTTGTSVSAIASRGIARLGGNDFDMEVVSKIYKDKKIYLLQQTHDREIALKNAVRQAKETMQRNGFQPYTIDLTAYGKDPWVFTKEIYEDCLKVFQPAFDLTDKLLAQYEEETKPVIYPIGGSSCCPMLQQKIREHYSGYEVYTGSQASMNTADGKLIGGLDSLVAQGAAAYAKDYEEGKVFLRDVTAAISCGVYDGTTQVLIAEDSPTPITGSVVLTNPVEAADIELDFYQGAERLISDNRYIGTMHLDLGEIVPANHTYIEVEATVTASGMLLVTATDLVSGSKSDIKLKLKGV